MKKIMEFKNQALKRVLCKPGTRLSILVFFFVFVILAFWFLRTDFVTTGASAAVSDVTSSKEKNTEASIDKQKIQETGPKDVKIVIDPGHGGDDSGTYYGDVYEKNLNLDIALRFGKLLKQEGIPVVFTREKDLAVDLLERAKIANDLDATLFISVHNNRMPDEPDYRGTETLYCPTVKNANVKVDGERLAAIIQKELVNTLNTRNNGIIERPNLAVLHRTKMPAVIAEIAYVSNWSDRSKLTSADFREKAAEGLSSGTIKALREMGAVKDSAGKWVF